MVVCIVYFFLAVDARRGIRVTGRVAQWRHSDMATALAVDLCSPGWDGAKFDVLTESFPQIYTLPWSVNGKMWTERAFESKQWVKMGVLRLRVSIWPVTACKLCDGHVLTARLCSYTVFWNV